LAVAVAAVSLEEQQQCQDVTEPAVVVDLAHLVLLAVPAQPDKAQAVQDLL
jgi:hypothetical protein